jgi:hypothetical protein
VGGKIGQYSSGKGYNYLIEFCWFSVGFIPEYPSVSAVATVYPLSTW